LALAALATLGARGLRDAILAEDTRALVSVPGLGRKTAQRLVLELGGALTTDDAPAFAAAGSGGDTDPRAEVRLALSSLGYEPAEITRALQALDGYAADDAETLLRAALQTLAGDT